MKDYAKLREERFSKLSGEVLEYFTSGMMIQRPSCRELGVEGMRNLELFGPLEPDPAIDYEDLEIPGPARAIPTRIYRPKHLNSDPQPIYLHTHGGGYVSMGGDVNMPGSNKIALQSDCIVVVPDYCLPPEYPFPQGLEECYAALEWTIENAEEVGGRPDGICVGGGCTGGNIAAVVALMARDAGLPLAAQDLYCTLFDARCDYESHYENGEGYTLSHDDCVWVVEQYLQDLDLRFDWRASPILVPSVKGVAPALIRDGEWDVLRDESIAYANRLRDAGVEFQLNIVPECSHTETPATDASRYQELKEFMQKYCGA
tara:strand:- start:3351 stop:4298 length:948 start_codon:yes stop_codon:yes gene_type:complete